jgi:hypothetical protein
MANWLKEPEALKKQSPKCFPLAAVSLTLALVVSGAPAYAQVDRTAITGTVTDEQGERIPQANVHATESATGLQRETLTTSQGTYELPGLPPGLYSIQFFRTGFSTLNAERVELVVGQTRTLNARLEVAHGRQQTTVTEPLIQLDKVDATIGTAIERAQVSDLPVNGRNWATLTALAPGAINNGGGDQRTIRFAGHGLDDNNLTLDGVDATAVYNQEQREYMRLNIPLDSIAEFQVQSRGRSKRDRGRPSVRGFPLRHEYFSWRWFRLFSERCPGCTIAIRRSRS